MTNQGDNTITIIGLTPEVRLPGDANRDGIVDLLDLAAVAAVFNTTSADTAYDPAADLNGDGIIDIFDLVLVGRDFGREAQEP